MRGFTVFSDIWGGSKTGLRNFTDADTAEIMHNSVVYSCSGALLAVAHILQAYTKSITNITQDLVSMLEGDRGVDTKGPRSALLADLVLQNIW